MKYPAYTLITAAVAAVLAADAARAGQATAAPQPFVITRPDAGVPATGPDVQIRNDALSALPQLNVWAAGAVRRGDAVIFQAWSNYLPWIRNAELRILRAGQDPQSPPLAVLPANPAGATRYTVAADETSEVLFYVLRVYDAAGRFDETRPRPLTLLAQPAAAVDADTQRRDDELGRRDNNLVVRNIPVRGGTVLVSATGLASGSVVTALGLEEGADAQGRVVLRQILPAGVQRIDVHVRAPGEPVRTVRRELDIAANDLFYVAVGDLTIGRNRVTGPAALVTGDTQHYDDSVYFDGRAAFYVKRKIDDRWVITASADTREQPVDQLFSNFATKDPRYLLRSINPDLSYPVFGDDSVTVDDAPTQGKFYVKAAHGDSHVMWGNFQASWAGTGTELLQYSRGLYGADARYRSEDVTSFGEKRTQLEGFEADPGTVGAREEFRATDGSLYYLHHQDITEGSEQVWVEVRDRDSGLVIDRRRLNAAQDYDINVLQGRIVLRDSLSSYAGSSGLVLDSTLGGNPQYLVVSYEYVPGMTSVSNMTSGLRASHWFNDYLRVGITGYHQGEHGADQTLGGIDATLRYKPATFLRVEAARSDGAGTAVQSSTDGGFGFNNSGTGGGTANAYRVEGAVDLAEVGAGRGRISGYVQDKERGYASPGQVTYDTEAQRQQGLKAEVALAPRTTLTAKADHRDGDLQNANNAELAVRQDVTDQWTLSAGARRDDRSGTVASASPLLSQPGERTDAQLRGEYHAPREPGKPAGNEDWSLYGFVQSTLSRDDTRDANDRVGAGTSYRVSERLKLQAEASDGSLGMGGRLGADYRLANDSTVYVNYLVENDSPLATYRGRQDTAVAGSSYKVADDLRVFEESRAVGGAGPDSLSNALGTEWSLDKHWTLGAKAEIGYISDPLAGDTRRRAGSVSVGYKQGEFKYNGNVELRVEDNNLTGRRDTWLVRNAFGYQATPAWRLLGKYNWSDSSNSGGAFYDGAYHELVAGAAYRPVDNERWNTLIKYTNLYDLPSAGQVSPAGVTVDYAQRSNVFAIDTIHDVVPSLALGGKYAVRVGELKSTKVDGPWFSSRADLVVLRADWHVTPQWDALGELRRLHATEAADARKGVLLAVYRRLGGAVKLGAGYNFTDYSDDLTDLSYRSRGWFVNILGTL